MSFYHNSNETKPGYQAGRWIFYVLLVCCKACKFFLYLMHKRPHLTFVYPIRAIKWGALATRTGKKQFLSSKTIHSLCTCISLFLYISLPALHDYDGKMFTIAFCGGRQRKATTFFFSPQLRYSPLEMKAKKTRQHCTN